MITFGVMTNKFTQCIERINPMLRIWIKRLNQKTIGHSKTEEIHDQVIGTLIACEYYISQAI
ncbi:IS1 family transposase [Xenorhabdus stockiae]|uniref:IS1 family transposase n=1 Tax=Xenorhabdus stockiae TaxID=351614 RepID=UPI00406339A9